MMTMSMRERRRFFLDGPSFGLEVRFDLGFDGLFGRTFAGRNQASVVQKARCKIGFGSSGREGEEEREGERTLSS
jgi:hypothetical protein